MKKKICFLIFCFILFINYSFNEKTNYVPNEETAIKIAEAVWLPIFGKSIYDKRPFNAVLNGDSIWHVYGTLHSSSIKVNDEGDTVINMIVGGVPHIYINKSDGKIYKVYHDK